METKKNEMISPKMTGKEVQIPESVSARMRELGEKSIKKHTMNAYGSDWRQWAAYADFVGAEAMPADPIVVAAFLTECADGLVFKTIRDDYGRVVSTTTDGTKEASNERKYTTLKRAMNTISSAHTRTGEEFDRGDKALRGVLDGLRRERGRDVRRVKPLTADLALEIVADFGSDNVDLRDTALLLIGIASGCRRSELSGLDWKKLGGGTGYINTEDGNVVISLVESKTGKGDVQTIAIPAGLAVEALQDWINIVPVETGEPVFRSINRHGIISAQRLSDRSIARIIKTRTKAHGLEPEEFSGHSLRAGLITSARKAGVDKSRIKMQSRHKSDAMLDVYTRDIDQMDSTIVEDIGLADKRGR